MDTETRARLATECASGALGNAAQLCQDWLLQQRGVEAVECVGAIRDLIQVAKERIEDVKRSAAKDGQYLLRETVAKRL